MKGLRPFLKIVLSAVLFMNFVGPSISMAQTQEKTQAYKEALLAYMALDPVTAFSDLSNGARQAQLLRDIPDENFKSRLHEKNIDLNSNSNVYSSRSRKIIIRILSEEYIKAAQSDIEQFTNEIHDLAGRDKEAAQLALNKKIADLAKDAQEFKFYTRKGKALFFLQMAVGSVVLALVGAVAWILAPVVVSPISQELGAILKMSLSW